MRRDGFVTVRALTGEGELHMPFRLPTSYIPAQKALFNESAFTEDMVKMLLGNVRDYAQQRQVPVLDYLLPHD